MVKVSVCVVTYNQEKYIGQCLESLVTQRTNFPFEVIVGDDCSTDKTRDVIREYQKNYPSIIKPIFREKNIGAYNNFIETHNAARCKYICHCDGDDIWYPDKLQMQADFLDLNIEYSVVWGRMDFFDDQGNFLSGKTCDYSMFPNGELILEDSLMFGSVTCHSSVMYRSCARHTKKSDIPLLDLYYTWEFLSHGKGKILSDVLGKYRVYSSSSIAKKDAQLLKILNAKYSLIYYSKFPQCRKSICYFSLFNMLVELKNFRFNGVATFLKVYIRTFSLINPISFYAYVRQALKFRAPALNKGNRN